MAGETDWTNLGINAGLSGLNYYLGQNSLTNQNRAMMGGYDTAGNYVADATNRATGVMQPYIAAGASALPALQAASGQVGAPMSMQDYQNSPYYQVAQAAQKQNADQLKATAGATGMYGSGNMANALQQNALTTQMGMYDTAAQRNLEQQQASANALYGLAGLGQVGAQSLGSNYMRGAEAMGGLALGRAGSQAGSMAGSTGNMQALLTTLAPLIKAGIPEAISAYNKLMSGNTGYTPEELSLLSGYESYYEQAGGFDPVMGYSSEPTIYQPPQWEYSAGYNPNQNLYYDYGYDGTPAPNSNSFTPMI